MARGGPAQKAGFMTLSCATRLPELWCCAIDTVGMYNLETVAVQLVLQLADAVALVLVAEVLHHMPPLPEGAHHLLGLLGGDPGVVAALDDHRPRWTSSGPLTFES